MTDRNAAEGEVVEMAEEGKSVPGEVLAKGVRIEAEEVRESFQDIEWVLSSRAIACLQAPMGGTVCYANLSEEPQISALIVTSTSNVVVG